MCSDSNVWVTYAPMKTFSYGLVPCFLVLVACGSRSGDDASSSTTVMPVTASASSGAGGMSSSSATGTGGAATSSTSASTGSGGMGGCMPIDNVATTFDGNQNPGML